MSKKEVEKTPEEIAAEEAKRAARKNKKVRVICEGTLGTLGLKKGDITDEEEYVELLETERGRTLVELAK